MHWPCLERANKAAAQRRRVEDNAGPRHFICMHLALISAMSQVPLGCGMIRFV